MQRLLDRMARVERMERGKEKPKPKYDFDYGDEIRVIDENAIQIRGLRLNGGKTHCRRTDGSDPFCQSRHGSTLSLTWTWRIRIRLGPLHALLRTRVKSWLSMFINCVFAGKRKARLLAQPGF